MTKKIITKKLIMWVVLIMCVGIFSACGGKDGKIDVGGEDIAGKPTPPLLTRVMLDKTVYNIDETALFIVGFGFRGQYPEFMDKGAIIVLSIEAKDFVVTDEKGKISNNIYEKTFEDYADDKFICSKQIDRNLPNYYEEFDLVLNSVAPDSFGTIKISAIVQWNDGSTGQYIDVYFATNASKIAFSAKSVEDAQKKLKWFIFE